MFHIGYNYIISINILSNIKEENVSFNSLKYFSDPPKVKLNLGSGIDRNRISEGQDVYMDCEVRANPRIYKVEWIHNVSYMPILI